MKFLSIGALALFTMCNVEAQQINSDDLKQKGLDFLNQIKNGQKGDIKIGKLQSTP